MSSEATPEGPGPTFAFLAGGCPCTARFSKAPAKSSLVFYLCLSLQGGLRQEVHLQSWVPEAHTNKWSEGGSELWGSSTCTAVHGDFANSEAREATSPQKARGLKQARYGEKLISARRIPLSPGLHRKVLCESK